MSVVLVATATALLSAAQFREFYRDSFGILNRDYMIIGVGYMVTVRFQVALQRWRISGDGVSNSSPPFLPSLPSLLRPPQFFFTILSFFFPTPVPPPRKISASIEQNKTDRDCVVDPFVQL